MRWKSIQIEGIESIEKCVGEFDVTALRFFETIFDGAIHYGMFKVKIYEQQDALYYAGYTNLRIVTADGGYEGGYGDGATIEQALQSTIQHFCHNLKEYRAAQGRGLSKHELILLPYDEY